jgi:gamma-glutamyltranspeptidase/glutathione hydrolase
MNSALGFMGGSGGPAEGQPGHVTGFLGGVVADEPQAALLGRQILSAGGNAADAAAAMGLALAVTLPSRASLGSGGACLAYVSGGPDAPQAVMFTSVPPQTAAGASRPAAVPMLARGMFALQNRFGHLPFEQLVLPVEQVARQGVRTSRALVRDLAVVAGPLAGDPGAAAIFYRNGQPLGEGELMVQPDLGATLGQLRTAGVGDLYLGGLAQRFVAAAAQAGASLTVADLRGAVPKFAGSLSVGAARGDKVAFLPPPADGGLAAAAASQVLQDNPADIERANTHGLAVVSRWRQGGTDLAAVTTAADLPPANLPPLPASTTFAALDRNGNAVVCAVTMGNLFGTGRIAPGTGILLAASPNWLPPPLLAAAIAYNPDRSAFRALVGGSGQAGAPLAVAMMITQALGQRGSVAQPNPGSVPDPGRANVIACSQYLPKADASCAYATDPRGFGLASGGG